MDVLGNRSALVVFFHSFPHLVYNLNNTNGIDLEPYPGPTAGAGLDPMDRSYLQSVGIAGGILLAICLVLLFAMTVSCCVVGCCRCCCSPKRTTSSRMLCLRSTTILLIALTGIAVIALIWPATRLTHNADGVTDNAVSVVDHFDDVNTTIYDGLSSARQLSSEAQDMGSQLQAAGAPANVLTAAGEVVTLATQLTENVQNVIADFPFDSLNIDAEQDEAHDVIAWIRIGSIVTFAVVGLAVLVAALIVCCCPTQCSATVSTIVLVALFLVAIILAAFTALAVGLSDACYEFEPFIDSWVEGSNISYYIQCNDPSRDFPFANEFLELNNGIRMCNEQLDTISSWINSSSTNIPAFKPTVTALGNITQDVSTAHDGLLCSGINGYIVDAVETSCFQAPRSMFAIFTTLSLGFMLAWIGIAMVLSLSRYDILSLSSYSSLEQLDVVDGPGPHRLGSRRRGDVLRSSSTSRVRLRADSGASLPPLPSLEASNGSRLSSSMRSSGRGETEPLLDHSIASRRVPSPVELEGMYRQAQEHLPDYGSWATNTSPPLTLAPNEPPPAYDSVFDTNHASASSAAFQQQSYQSQ